MSDFDPDAYLAAKGGGFDPDRYLAEKQGGPGLGESFGRGAAQGATLGFGDEIQGAIQAAGQKVLPDSLGGGNPGRKSFADLYRENRDAARKDNSDAEASNPKTFLAGNIAGGAITTPLMPGGGPRAATLGGRLLQAARMGAALGAAGGLGSSTADVTQGDVMGAAGDTLKGGLAGGVLAAGGTLAGESLAPLAMKLRELGINAGRRALTNVPSSLSRKMPISDEAVLEAANQGAFRPFATTATVRDRLEGARDNVGSLYGQILDTLEAKGVTGPHAQTLAAQLAAEGKDIAGKTLGSPRPAVFGNIADELAPGIGEARDKILKQIQAQGITGQQAEALADQAMQSWKPAVPGKPLDAAGNLGLSQSESMKRELQHLARSEYDKLKNLQTPKGEASEAVAARVRAAIEDSVQAQAAKAPAEAAAFEPVKEQLSRIIEASNAAREGAGRALKRGAISLNDVAAAAGGGVPAGMLMHALKTRGASTAAWAAPVASQAADWLAASPQGLGQQLVRQLGRRGVPLLAEQAGEGVAK